MAKYAHGNYACGSKKCYYLQLMQQIGYQGHRIVPMAQYAPSNHACGSTQLR
ncbi:hypothetical protein SCLCIDRAFT_25407 [Scleroderma citrinum Foug A]|uniref:Uncharacterized protein n=1 Tax=Scleroderma citrinum Foug A TaxID=1036808 RepID=A0A0C3E1F6_9AGAM|nr:hypothetical protein SCLCIDRAFT_25407 [Scleroderma citrinum Foug A]